MKAILTKYVKPTNTRGARIKAWCEGGHSATVPYDADFDTEGAHKLAAEALRAKMNWTGKLIAGGTPDGYVFVFEPKSVEDMRNALGNLCQHVAGNRGNRDGNPYCKLEMKAALQALYQDKTGGYTEEFSDYVNAADAWKNAL